MARITVEDCLQNTTNRFHLVLQASKRAHLLELGAADPLVPAENDKPTVIALREIAAGHDVTQTRTDAAEEVLDEVSVSEQMLGGGQPDLKIVAEQHFLSGDE